MPNLVVIVAFFDLCYKFMFVSIFISVQCGERMILFHIGNFVIYVFS